MEQRATKPYYVEPPKKTGWRRALPWIIAGAVLLFIIIGLLVLAARNRDDTGNYYPGEPYIAEIFIDGTISDEPSAEYDQQFLMDTVDSLIEDEDNAGLFIYLDTPGGEVLPTAELAQRIVDYKEATGRPVYAYGHNSMASGGYWLACAADVIYANRYCTTGSIGVTFGSLLDISGLLEQYGIKVNTIASGAEKSMGSMLEPMTDTDRAIMQSMVDEYYGYFLNWVTEQRGMSEEQLRPLADGRIYTALQAKNNGLIDEVGTYEEALTAMCRMLLEEYGLDCYILDFESDYDSYWDGLDWLHYLSEYKGGSIMEILNALPRSGPLAYYAG